MTLHEFATLVGEMRDAQRDYFKGRTKEALIRSKEREKEVDCAVKHVLSGMNDMEENDE